jgi:hypothetical protein
VTGDDAASVKEQLILAIPCHHGVAAGARSGGIGCEDLKAGDAHGVIRAIPGIVTKDEDGARSHDAGGIVGGVRPVGRPVEPPKQADAWGHSQGAVEDVGALRHVDRLPERNALSEFDGMLQGCDRGSGGAGIAVVAKRRRRKEDGAAEVAVDAVPVGIPVVARVVRFAGGARASEQPEETAVAVQRNGHPVLTAGLHGSLTDRLPSLGLRTCTERLDPIAEIAVWPGEFNASPLLDEAKRGGFGQC